MPAMELFLGLFGITFLAGAVIAYFFVTSQGYAKKSEYDQTRKQLRQADREIQEQLQRAEIELGRLQQILEKVLRQEEQFLEDVQQLADACESLEAKNDLLGRRVQQQQRWVSERKAELFAAILQVVEGALGLENLIRHHVREAAQETNNDEVLRTVGSTFTSLKVWKREHMQRSGDDRQDDLLKSSDITELAELLGNLSASVVRGLCSRPAH
ncbi:MAG: hypothetical protein R6V19_12440 [Armatimonadota bacterium]